MILREIKKHYSFKNDAEFARFLGISPQTLSSWQSRNTFDLELLYAKCIDFNAEYLITGQGPMLRNHGIINSGNGQQVVANHNNGTINADNRQYYSDSPDVLRAQIDTLNERIKEKDAQIKEKDAQINKLIELLGKKYESGQ